MPGIKHFPLFGPLGVSPPLCSALTVLRRQAPRSPDPFSFSHLEARLIGSGRQARVLGGEGLWVDGSGSNFGALRPVF